MANLRSQNLRNITAFLFVTAASIILSVHFHDRPFWSYDDGFKAHVAERVLEGEVLHRDVQEMHGGYSNFVNALALKLFGRRIVSLRYPVVILTVLETGLLFLLFLPKGLCLAVVSAFMITVFSFIQFSCPMPHWYCLFLTLVLICILQWLPLGMKRIFYAGVLIGLIYFFRQLTGIFIAMATLSIFLLEGPLPQKSGRSLFAKFTAAVMMGGLAFYLWITTDWIGFILFGAWPLLLSVKIFFLANKDAGQVNRTIGLLLAGFVASALPLIIYHASHHSIGDWLRDTLFEVLHDTTHLHLKFWSFGYLLLGGGYQLSVAGLDVYALANGFYWLALPLAALCNGVFTVFLFGEDKVNGSRQFTLPIMACFHALVSLFNQSPIYLYFTVGLSLISWLWILREKYRGQVFAALVFCLVLLVVAVGGHAGQPTAREVRDFFGGRRYALVKSEALPRSGLRMKEEELASYRKLVELIHQETQAGEPIFVFPNNAEVYFLSERKNPFRFYNTALGLLRPADTEKALEYLASHPPKLIVYHEGDNYETTLAKPVVEYVRDHYELIETISFFQIYRYRAT
ncbi:MAG: hypothetical protein HY587_00520 [Candidatus Omnitrophica bacterium]|nr:hypothetical protein [Candidatus Omnitrophota bacterium]